MKKIIFIISSFVVFASCGNLEELNTNTKDFAVVKGESLFSNGQKNLVDQMVGANVNENIFRFFTQQWTETTYLDEVNYDIVTRTIPGNHWNYLYRTVLKNLDEATKVLTADPLGIGETDKIRKNKLATVEITKVYTWSVLVQSFGNVPYKEALDITKPVPVYDDAATIYKDLIARLNVAIANLDVTVDGMGNYDNIYHGDVAKTKLFANSLKLRMGLVLADADAALAKTTVESAVTSGVISSNADNAAMAYMADQPNTNPLYVDLVASGRHDFIPANTLVDAMNTLSDPRRQFYMTTLGGVYVGGVYGFSNTFASYSHIADPIQEAKFEGTIFDAAETEFLLAEAAERGFSVGGTAQSHYNAGIKASILYWGGVQADVDAYLATAKVDYTNAASGANWKEKIGTQAWIALYNRGWESWQEWVRLDYPILVAPSTAKSAIPLRLIYPISEQTLNGDAYKAAAAAIGGDLVTTKLFFDKH
ncbi:MAG: SusD/RagB family nutrient-binding outer membrane lipoprotein [Paludibacter sp.]